MVRIWIATFLKLKLVHKLTPSFMSTGRVWSDHLYPQLGQSGAVELKWWTGIVRPLWRSQHNCPGNYAIYINLELNCFRKSLNTQLRHRLTHFGTRLNEDFFYILPPVCTDRRGGEGGSTIKIWCRFIGFANNFLKKHCGDVKSIGKSWVSVSVNTGILKDKINFGLLVN